jgi:catechol 2,3-dioxygenase-like lactoylglutathione lyase family enzyme
MRLKMSKVLLIASLALLSIPLFAEKEPMRPRIFGIARVQILVTDLREARSFYTKVLGQAHNCNWCEQMPGRSFLINEFQGISLSTASSPAPSNLIEEIAFATDDVAKLRRFLVAHNIAVSETQGKDKPAGPFFSVVDPEGHRISFIQSLGVTALKPGYPPDSPPPSNLRLIHAGFVVRDLAAEDKFYKDILGFHVYWHGGMKNGETDWVDMQVPDGTDWLEYMLNVSPSADKKQLGVMNHIALGVENIKSVLERLRDDRVVPILEEPQIGRDGKWQLNLYDPDFTRVEFMEFSPVRPPCCSPYTGPHPGPPSASKAPTKP